MKGCWRVRSRDAWAIVFVAAFFVAFFGWVLFGGGYLVGGDAFAYSYPLRAFFWGEARAGHLTLWLPWVLSGYPMLATSQLSPGYPVTWCYLFLPPYVAEQVFVLAPFPLATAFTYAYGRELNLSRSAALLAGLAYAYGGATTNLLAVVGYHTNSMLWLPLVLVAVERARTRPFAACLVGGALAYAPSVLGGYGQGFLYVGIAAISYALFLSLFVAPRTGEGAKTGWRDRSRWRPLAVACGAVACGAGVGAFQILETERAVRRSVRSALSYEMFVTASFSPATALRSLVAPLYVGRFADVTTYVAPLALLLAVFACVAFVRRREARDPRVLFWLAAALVAWVSVLGDTTPFYPLLYRLPLVKEFRVPSRHAFEWTFAVSVLAAYGADALRRLATLRDAGARGARHATTTTHAAASDARRVKVMRAAAWGALFLALTVGALWWRATGAAAAGADAVTGKPLAWSLELWYVGLPMSSYLVWKAAFTLLVVAALWLALRSSAARGRAVLLCAVFALACFVEPYILVTRWWQPFLKSRARLTTPAPATVFLRQQLSAHDGRAYTHAELFAEEYTDAPRYDPQDLTALYGVENVAGYEPLMLTRYSRALGGVALDTYTPLPRAPRETTLLGARSRVLDLLNTRFFLADERARLAPGEVVWKDGVEFAAADLPLALKPGETASLSGADATADALALVSALSGSVGVGQGATVARVRFTTADGEVIERELRAGVDTAEWAHEHADVRAAVRHALAPVFDRSTGNGDTAASLRYLARVPVGRAARVSRVEIANVSENAFLIVTKATLYDSASARSTPLAPDPLAARRDAAHWQGVYERDGVLILRNTRACPRAWLVAGAEAVDGEEALRRIRGEPSPDGVARGFDPMRTALLEVRPEELPPLAPSSSAQSVGEANVVSYEPNRIVVETDAVAPSVLVVSELFYPGWEARVDGRAQPILLTDYLLRGVAVPAGRHHVEMRYRAPAARNGAVVSALTLVGLAALAFASRRLGQNSSSSLT